MRIKTIKANLAAEIIAAIIGVIGVLLGSLISIGYNELVKNKADVDPQIAFADQLDLEFPATRASTHNFTRQGSLKIKMSGTADLWIEQRSGEEIPLGAYNASKYAGSKAYSNYQYNTYTISWKKSSARAFNKIYTYKALRNGMFSYACKLGSVSKGASYDFSIARKSSLIKDSSSADIRLQIGLR